MSSIFILLLLATMSLKGTGQKIDAPDTEVTTAGRTADSPKNQTNSISPDQTQNISYSDSTYSKTSEYDVSDMYGYVLDGISLFSNILEDFGQSDFDLEQLLAGQPESTQQCFRDVKFSFQSAKKKLPWALKLLDANGKPGTGVLNDNVRFLGEFDQCQDINTDHDRPFDTNYCISYLFMSRARNTTFPKPIGFVLGLCTPISCDSNNLQTILNGFFYARPDLDIVVPQTVCHERHLSLSSMAKVTICFLSILSLLLVVATVYDAVLRMLMEMALKQDKVKDNGNHKASNLNADTVSDFGKCLSEHSPIITLERHNVGMYSDGNSGLPIGPEHPRGHKRELCHQFLMSFSLYTNVQKLLSTQQPPGTITCLNGIRFLSLAWIVLFHLYGVAVVGKISDNETPYLKKSYKRWTFTIIPNALVAVDTFFVMSGLLVSYTVLKKLGKDDVTPKFFGNFYFHRIWRLTPPYMWILLIFATLFKYFSDGPFWSQDGYENCSGAWWTNLLYINNFVKDEDQCMSWTWYLANDFQFYVISPLLFLPLLYYQWKGLVVSFIFVLISIITSGVISSANHLPPFRRLEYLVPGSKYNFYSVYYIKPYTRMGSYVIGLVTGYLLIKTECKLKMPRILVGLGWLAAVAIGMGVAYGPYDAMKEEPLDNDVSALYNALHRSAWAISVSWVIFACANGYGGFVNTMLSWKALVPISKLTYCAYLIHPIVFIYFIFSQRKSFYLDNMNVAFTFVAGIVLTYAIAFVATLAFEIPAIGLEKILKGRGRQGQPIANNK